MPMSSHACWTAGGRKAPEETNRRKLPPSLEWTERKSQRRAE